MSTSDRPEKARDLGTFFIRLGVALLVLAVLLVGPFAVAVWATMDWTTGAGSGDCQPVTTPRVAQGDQEVELRVRQGEITTLAFGRSFDTRRLTVVLEPKGDAVIKSRPKRLRLFRSEFRREDDARFPTKAINANASIQRSLVRVRLCIERPPGTHPGTYTGSLTITDPRVREVAVPIIITLAYPHWPMTAYLVWLVILAGAVYVFVLHVELDPNEPIVSTDAMKDFRTWASKWGGVVAVVAGSAAAISAYTASYLASPDWGASTSQFFGLVATCFTAFVTASSATQIAAKKGSTTRQSEKKGE